MPGMRFTIGINRYFNAGPAFRTTLVSVAPPGETAYTAMPEGSRRASAATHQAIMSFASAYALLGTYLTFGPLRIRASTAAGLSPPQHLAAQSGGAVYLYIGAPPRARPAHARTTPASWVSPVSPRKTPLDSP